jgi:hypothetical protein
MKLYQEDIPNFPNIIVQDDVTPAPPGYTEKVSIDDWYNCGIQVIGNYYGFNYLTWRKEILSKVIAIAGADYANWNNLSASEKEVACILILAPYAERMTTVDDATDKKNWDIVIQISQGRPVETMKGRALVVEMMREAVSEWYRVETLSKDDADDFYRSVFNLIEWYIGSNTQDFTEWLNNTVGSPYENDGFLQKTYYSVERRDELQSIYDGNYLYLG